MQKNISDVGRLLMILSLLLCPFAMKAQDPIPEDINLPHVTPAALDSILPHYEAWSSVELSGKMRAAGLPLSPTVKLYMMNGSEISLSIRAPFLGEVGRIELNNDSVTAVYKLKKVYCKESVENARRIYPGLISDIQSLLLGRIVVFGSGELNELNAGLVEFEDIVEDGGWSVSQPDVNRMISGVELEYIVAPDGRLSGVMLESAIAGKENRFGIGYSYPSLDGFSMMLAKAKDGEWQDIASLDFNSVIRGALPPAPLKIPRSYRRVGIKDFIKSF